jgi:2-deoxy-D-gluconate 3-dehydrogenase
VIEINADLGTTGPVDTIVGQTMAEFGRIDILVNNAGIIRRQDALDFSEDDWDAVMGVNLKSAFFLAQAVAREFRKADRPGRIINIASMLSFQGGVRVASYTASKSGLAGITRLLANEWAKFGICVNAIAPGYFETNNTSALRADPDRNRDILARIPAGRWGMPSDLGGAAVFLASDSASYVHGAIIPVDGGWLAR